ncbi:similar to carotenoid biosynthesis protein, crtK gene product [Cyanidioschyzon merolae strain 10D]|jgi:benzodiazapine receptor|uniref:Similar to carotenoid biosynthesis protein, crtK gene product n=1 Tax=Cyanidioschyzon merolae (strain NIES-3377 / 10D) TaxID=280699 RepID=M1V785_CYAM1|nr:similar to carotenoid biosynthesis protein, crtK gene product [Cyanidioschyzon merolae strain 10D]BAM82840.1 similar to carotenoid biosynthesis protein, crtK gene product [Cyanidioschyzon merolae strain 10D]|eukprot:XP_005538876.1 similar to carotenoid biosynthesis protein, crtK gene product [Cyanidioschyzon merolae strain 10D]
MEALREKWSSWFASEQGSNGLAGILSSKEKFLYAVAAAAVVSSTSVLDNLVMYRRGGQKAEGKSTQGNGTMNEVASPATDPWYRSLRKPWFHPPNWVFPAVWIPLKALQTGALYLVWTSEDVSLLKRLTATGLYVIHISLGTLWNHLFFGKHKIRKSLYAMGGFYATLAGSIGMYWTVNPTAAALLAPTQVWATIAAALNYQSWALNPDMDADG